MDFDRHLNLFRTYAESGRENNLTRAFAIVLRKDLIFLDYFFNLITKKKLVEIIDENSDIVIDIQKDIKTLDIENVEEIYPVGLTTQAREIEGVEARKTESPITDLVVRINNICIIIEIKRHSEKCEAQVKNQIDKLKEANGKNNLNVINDEKYLSWEDVIRIAEKSMILNNITGNYNCFTEEFILFIEQNYSDFFPVKRIDYIEFKEDVKTKKLIEKRIEEIEKEITIRNKFDEYPGYIPLNKEWAQRYKIFLDEKSRNVNIAVWVGDNIRQGLKFASINKSRNFLHKNEVYSWKGHSYRYIIRTYIRFSHIMGKGIFWVTLKDNNIDYDKFLGNLCKKWNKEKWEEMKEQFKIYTKIDLSQDDEWNKIENKSDRKFVTLSIGIEIKCSINYNEFQKIEKHEKTLEYFSHVMNEMIEIVEKE